MIVRRIGLAVLISCAMIGSGSSAPLILPHYEQPFFVAPVTGINGSTLQGTCVAFAPTLTRLHLRCSGLQGGRTPTGVQLIELDQVFGERALVNVSFGGGTTFTHEILNVEARVTHDLLDGVLGIRFNSGAGPEGMGRFAPADETRTLLPMIAVQGGNDRIGICEVSTITSPPVLGIFCHHNVSGPANLILHAGTVANRSTELCRRNFSGNSGNDIISALVESTSSINTTINTQPININVLNSSNWIAGNNLPCRPGPDALCLNDGRFRVQLNWRNSQGQSGVGRPAASSNESGLFYFFDPANTEMMVKVLNGCSTTSRYWVFAASATSVEYALTVTDTRSGGTKTYLNPLGTPASAITDTSAFATCP